MCPLCTFTERVLDISGLITHDCFCEPAPYSTSLIYSYIEYSVLVDVGYYFSKIEAKY